MQDCIFSHSPSKFYNLFESMFMKCILKFLQYILLSQFVMYLVSLILYGFHRLLIPVVCAISKNVYYYFQKLSCIQDQNSRTKCLVKNTLFLFHHTLNQVLCMRVRDDNFYLAFPYITISNRSIPQCVDNPHLIMWIFPIKVIKELCRPYNSETAKFCRRDS